MALDPQWVDQTLGLTDDELFDEFEPPEGFGETEPDNSAAGHIRMLIGGMSQRRGVVERHGVTTQVNTALLNLAEDITQQHQQAHRENWMGSAGLEATAEQTYAQQRADFAAMIDEVRGTVPLDARVTDYVVAFDHDGTMSQALGVEVAEHYGRNKHHGGLAGKPVSPIRTVQPDLDAPVTQPVSHRERATPTVEHDRHQTRTTPQTQQGGSDAAAATPRVRRHPAIAEVLGERGETKPSEQTEPGPQL